MDNKRKIVFVSGSLNRSGAQRVISLLANRFADLGWDVHLALLLSNNIGFQLNSRITVHDIARGYSAKHALNWIKDLKKIFIEIKPSVIVSFVGRINILTMLAAKGLGFPVVLSERNDPNYDRRGKMERSLCKKLYAKADKVIFQTSYQAGCYLKSCDKNSEIIVNPISAPVYTGSHPVKDIICVGKLMDQKNHPMMINAFAQIASEFPDTDLWIYGEGKLRAALEEMINSHGLTSRIHMPGNIDNIFDVMQKNEFFVMCSNYEGLSNALLEAMTSGMICISTKWNGVTDVICDGENGFLIPLDDQNALAELLRKVIKADNEMIRKMAIDSGKSYSSDLVIEQWYKVINGLAK